uniref:GPI inositol-deacylase n=1 Tax=Scleropages formosus TaxID=113540 RepID=A0A8C9V108_SCLFO
MKVATVAFYGSVLGLLGMGLRELLAGFEENRCSMTYMFEYPEYRRVQLPRRVAQQYPGYGLYLYGEGIYAQETRGLKLRGAPVLFLPGNAGSYKQARSLGSVALRKAEDMGNRIHLNVFTVDFNEELVALYGGSLRRQTLFLYESIKAILKLYKDQSNPPCSVVLVGHSMGGVVARALFTLPRFNPRLVSLIVTQASPHQAPVLPMDSYLLEFYSAVRGRWQAGAEDLHNVTVLSVGGGHRDYQVRSGLTALPCSQEDPSKLSLVSTAVPRTWLSTDHLSIVWCKELVLTTVRAFFDLIEPDSRQFTQDRDKRMAVLKHHFVRHPVRLLGDQEKAVVTFSGPAEGWTEVNTLRLVYNSHKEPGMKYFLFALSGRRKAYSHFHCRSSSLDMVSWLYGCTQMNGSVCLQGVDLSWGTELLPAYKVVTVKLSELSSVSHLVIGASNLSGRQFSVECEWLNLEAREVSIPVPHILSLGFTVSDVTLNSTGLLHTVQLQHFHQVYQAFRITIVGQCKAAKDRLPSVYRLVVPWFREDFFTTANVPSVTEIAGMLHTSRPDNSSSVLLQLHTAPNCQYKVSIRTSFIKVLGQVLRFCGQALPVYTAIGLLLACEGQLNSLIKTGRPLEMSQAAAGAVQLHKVHLPVYLLHLLLRVSWFQSCWSVLSLPAVDVLPLSGLNVGNSEEPGLLRPTEDWTHLLGGLLHVLGAAVAFWGGALFRLSLRMLSLLLAPLHRPSLSRNTGTLQPWTQLLLSFVLGLLAWASCGALAFSLAYLCYLYRVLRLLMAQRTLRHVLNLAPQKEANEEDSSQERVNAPACSKESNGGTPLLSSLALQEVTSDLELHLTISMLLTLPLMLSAPSLIHWARSLRHTLQLRPDPCWPLVLPLLTSTVLLINCSSAALCHSKLLTPTSRLVLPLCVAMVLFTVLHLYRLTPLVCVPLGLVALSSFV